METVYDNYWAILKERFTLGPCPQGDYNLVGVKRDPRNVGHLFEESRLDFTSYEIP